MTDGEIVRPLVDGTWRYRCMQIIKDRTLFTKALVLLYVLI